MLEHSRWALCCFYSMAMTTLSFSHRLKESKAHRSQVLDWVTCAVQFNLTLSSCVVDRQVLHVFCVVRLQPMHSRVGLAIIADRIRTSCSVVKCAEKVFDLTAFSGVVEGINSRRYDLGQGSLQHKWVYTNERVWGNHGLMNAEDPSDPPASAPRATHLSTRHLPHVFWAPVTADVLQWTCKT